MELTIRSAATGWKKSGSSLYSELVLFWTSPFRLTISIWALVNLEGALWEFDVFRLPTIDYY